MSHLVSIRLTPENVSILDEMQKRQPLTLDELINRALNNYASRYDSIVPRC